MRKLAGIFAVILCLLADLSPATAQTLPRQEVETVARYVHQHMAGMMVGDGHIVTEEEASRLKYPLVPYQIIEATIIRGTISGMAEACKMDWKDHFYLPYMNAIRRAHRDWNDYQFAYVGALHGASMNSGAKAVSQTPCSEDLKARLLANR